MIFWFYIANDRKSSNMETEMTEMTPRFWDIFLELFGSLPRQGPGNRDSAAKALAGCTALTPRPRVLDLGCGGGAQTMYLADLLPEASIVAMDNHEPGIATLQNKIATHGLSGRVQALVGDMSAPGLSPQGFDLIWSEGALYSIGLENSLPVCLELLRPDGYLVFTDAIWLTDDPPADVKSSFDLDYPGMGKLEDDLRLLDRIGFRVVEHFRLPDEAWWTDFYTPMEQRILEMRGQYAKDSEVGAILDVLAQEPEMHRRHAETTYAYEYFICQRKND